MKPFTVTLATAGTSNWYPLDRFPSEQQTTIYARVSGSATYTVQHTPSDVGLLGVTAASAVGGIFNLSTMSAKTTSDYAEMDFPVGAVRFVVSIGTANTGSVDFTVVQAGN
jgi:hypothetical protein